MIGKLRGLVDTVEKDAVLLDVNGVGYNVSASVRTLRALPAAGEIAALYTEMQVREDAIQLFGFIDSLERECFRGLTTVKGVGAKVALAILSAASPDQIITALTLQDKTVFTQASGVGSKLAERIVLELKGKQFAGNIIVDSATSPTSTGTQVAIHADAISALLNLGYNRIEAGKVVSDLCKTHKDLSVSEMIRLALKELAQ